MTWVAALSGGIGLLVALFLIRTPIFVAFLILNLVGILIYFGPSGFGLFVNSIYATATNTALAAVPLFIIMGEVLFRSGAMESLFEALDRLVGRIRGRQFILCIILSAILGALSGAAMAVAGLLGRSLYPTMIKRGYDRRLSLGSILGGASLDPIIPPSVLAIIIAALAGVSTGKLLVAGIGPGILLTGMFLVYVVIRVWMKPELAPDLVDEETLDRSKSGGVLLAIWKLVPPCSIFALVMGFIIGGVATPTEAAAIGVLGAVLLSVYYGTFKSTMLAESIFAAVKISTILLLVMCSAVMFSQLLTFAGAPQALGKMVAESQLALPLLIFIMLALPFLLFMFLDQMAIMLVLIPIYKPVLALYGVDEIWFWTMFLVVATVGGISPPFGYTLFAMKSAVPNVPISELYKAAWPFVWLICLGIVFLVIFPSIVTYLPSLMR